MIMKLAFERCKDGKRIMHSFASISVYKCSSLHLESILPALPRDAKLSTPDCCDSSLRHYCAVVRFFLLFLKGRGFCGKIAADT